MFGAAFDIRRDRPFTPEERHLGPRVLWFRLKIPVVAGEPLLPIHRVAAAADFPNGISSIIDWTEGWIFITGRPGPCGNPAWKTKAITTF